MKSLNIPNSSGVYCLIAETSKLIYIGSTNNFRKRRNNHFSCFRKNNFKKGTTRLLDIYNSGENIIFNILEECSNLLEREQYWLDYYKNNLEYKVINEFSADRLGSKCSEEFRNKMSEIRKDKWKDSEYRKTTLERIKKTSFTSESLSKEIHVFNLQGDYLNTFISAKEFALSHNLSSICVASAARGNYRSKFKYKNYILIYNEVLYKLDELLEAHQELRVISSQAWESCKNTKKVQRLTDAQGSNNSDTSVQHII